jgi:methionine synthase II (cobalamin-independent)
MPDGETGKRYYFTRWQRAVFEKSSFVLSNRGDPGAEAEEPTGPISLKPLEYDDFALTSYADFCKLREQGIIPPGIRLQVCLPTPVNVIIGHVHPRYQVEVEVLYERALLTALRRIQDSIPKEDLAIQWDAALEFAMIEQVENPFFSKPWFSPLKEGLKERFARLTSAVDDGVEMGFHLCYGDINHKHFVEPKDAGHLVEMANLIMSLAPRDVNWIHMPVPKDRTDDDYYAPMRGLRLKKETQLYLGLAHAWDLDGTQSRISAARKVLENFGIATECGMGRTSKDEFEAVMEILAMLSERSKI